MWNLTFLSSFFSMKTNQPIILFRRGKKQSVEVKTRLNVVQGQPERGGGWGWWLLEVHFPWFREPCGDFCDSQTFPAPATENNPQENRPTQTTSTLYWNSKPLTQTQTPTYLSSSKYTPLRSQPVNLLPFSHWKSWNYSSIVIQIMGPNNWSTNGQLLVY